MELPSKKILFNKSTLLNLKAELLKKQEEVKEKKRLPEYKIENFKPPLAKSSQHGDKTEENNKTFKDSLQAVDTEELEAAKKAKKALEKKAELYEHLTNPVGESKMAGNFLVDFTKKKQLDLNLKKKMEQKYEPLPFEPIELDTNGEMEGSSDEDDWAEYVDCLGRSRRCPKIDLEYFLEKDKELKTKISADEDASTSGTGKCEPWNLQKSEKPFLVQKTNDYLKLLREKWEEQERRMLAKDKDIHYQDLLFDEARMHGVGYFAFSSDEAERQKQMDELMKRREETLREQATMEEKIKHHEEMVAARTKAARALLRLRAGLPADDDGKKRYQELLVDFLNQIKADADKRAKEKEQQIKEQLEKERQKIREAHVREWDRGKEGVEEKVKKFKEMTQEEYVEQQRAKRVNEFAPLPSTSTSNADSTFDDKGKELPPKTWSDVLPKPKTPPPPDIGHITDTKGLYFSTSKKSHQNMQYKNFVKPQEPTPIINEVSDDESDLQGKPEKRRLESNRAEIPPPPTYEYYGPESKKAKSHKPFESDIREAYDQGAKSLEPKPSTRRLPQQYDFSLE